jgi:tetratricopeptide (TPR) repeat protein
LRVGVNVGEVILEEGDYFGTTVVVAKRLCDRAEGGQVLVSDLVRSLVGSVGGHSFNDLGPLSLKGLADPLRAHELEWRAPGDGARRAPPRDERPATAGVLAREEPPQPPEGQPIPLPRLLAPGEEQGFVGRSPEVATLERLLDRARPDGPELAFIAGEPGIGKTRLVAEIARRAHADGTLVLYGHCYEESLVPFQPFVEALGHFVAHGDAEQVRRWVGDLAPELGRLVPELKRRLPGLPEPAGAEPDTARFRMFEAAALLIAQIARRQPVLLVLDDLQWADKPTLLLLRHVLRSIDRLPLLLLAAYREPEVGRGHPVAQAMGDLRRELSFQRLSLGGLGEEEVAALIGEWAGAAPSAEFTRALREETEGNPFFIEEVLRHLLQSGAIVEEDGQLRSAVPIARMGIPESVQELIARRLTHLSPDTNGVIAIAAVVGREFGIRVLERVCGRPAGELLESLSEASAARVIVEVPGSAGRYRFAHALVRETLYEGLSGARRVDLHLRIGEALEEIYAEDMEDHVAEIAHHFLEGAVARDVDKAIDYSARAGKRATERLAYEEAAGHYERALQTVELRERRDDRQRCELLLALGEAQRSAGDVPRARETLERAAEVARRLGAAELLARAALGRGEVVFGAAWWGSGWMRDESLVGLLEEARAALGEADSALRARVLTRLTTELYFSNAPERCEALSREAVDMARRLGEPAELALALVAGVFPTLRPVVTDAAFEAAQEGLDLARQACDRELELTARALRAILPLEQGDRAAFDAEVDAYLRLAEEFRQAHHIWYGHVMRGMQASLDGRLGEAERTAEDALALGRRAADPLAVLAFGAQMLVLRELQGRLPELEAPVKGFMVEYPALPTFRCVLPMIHALAGREPDARRGFDELAEGDFGWLPRDIFWTASMAALGLVCASLGDARRAAILYELLLPFEGRYMAVQPALGSLGPLSLRLGLLAVTMGRFDDAVRHYERALDLAAAMRDVPWIADTQYRLGAALVMRGHADDTERAQTLLGQARTTMTRLGIKSHLEHPLVLRSTLAVAEEHGSRTALERALGVAPRPAVAPPPARRFSRRASHAADRTLDVVRLRGLSALARAMRGASDEQLQRRFGSPAAQRALFTAMALSFQPDKAFGFEGEIAFELGSASRSADAAPDCWTLEVSGQRARARRGPGRDPAVTIRIGVPDLVRLATGQLNPVGALLEGITDVDGDITIASRIVEMFGGPSPRSAPS